MPFDSCTSTYPLQFGVAHYCFEELLHHTDSMVQVLYCCSKICVIVFYSSFPIDEWQLLGSAVSMVLSRACGEIM